MLLLFLCVVFVSVCVHLLSILITHSHGTLPLHFPISFCRRPYNRGRNMAIFRFFKMAAVRHRGFVMRVFGPPTKGIWRSLSMGKIWLELMQ